ncbi:MAG: hypothetical protein AAB906_02780 [Patescibacteria group bacterium]
MNRLLVPGLNKVGKINSIVSMIIVLIGELFGNSWSMIAGGVGLLVGLVMVWYFRPSKYLIPPGALTREAFAAHLAQVMGCQSLGEHDHIDDVQVYGLMLTANRAFGLECATPHHQAMIVGHVVDDLYNQYLAHFQGGG